MGEEGTAGSGRTVSCGARVGQACEPGPLNLPGWPNAAEGPDQILLGYNKSNKPLSELGESAPCMRCKLGAVLERAAAV